jgi:hypothetical protein
MDLKKAVFILIENSYLLAIEDKKNLLAKIDTLSEQELISLGKLLALEKKESLKKASKTIAECEIALGKLDKIQTFSGFSKKT